MKTQVTVVSAANLISSTNDDFLSPFVRVLGHSAEDYLIGETNYIEGTHNPKFNMTFTFDFFRASYLDFCIYNHVPFSSDQLIGIARIRVSDIIPQEIMKLPINLVRSGSIISDLTVRFAYQFSPVSKGTQGMFQRQIFLYTTFQSISTDSNPVDIDCLIVDHKWKIFYFLNSENWWTTVGRSSNQETVPVGAGYSQIRKLDINKIKDCEVHFYIKSNTFNGKLFLNFGCMRKEDLAKIKECSRDLTLFHQIEFDVTAGNVFSSPEKMLVKTFGRVDFTYEDSSDYHSLINKLVNGLKMTERHILAHSANSSLEGHSNIALIFGGTVYSESSVCDMDPKLFVFDRKNKKFVGSLHRQSENTGLFDFAIVNEGSNSNYVKSNLNGNSKYVDSDSIGINLGQLDPNFTIIVGVKIDQFILREVSHPMVRIVDSEKNEEIYFLPFKPSIYEASGELLFRIEKQDGNWVIVPIFHPVIDGNHMETAATDYINQGCPVYDEFEMNVKPLTQNKDYQIQKENMIV
ncbi:hypothetical protein M9Y10_024638 [Tritrichomonas musculus]|uniref:C2 domain-containing protein n=1 Tax=Tritrichomonas musculus TaxID=1915356 RepID=A0ABR2HAU5_9EUKA